MGNMKVREKASRPGSHRSKPASTDRDPKLRSLSSKPVSSEECRRSAIILEYTHNSSSALLKAFNIARAQRGSPRGMTTDEEQDLLRAMLVMAAAGLDAMTKQIVRDALPVLIIADPAVREGLQEFIYRRLRPDADQSETSGGRKFLAKILASPEYQAQVVEEYVNDLTGGSLLSTENLLRTANALGVPPEDLGADIQGLKRIFNIRHNIVHELDIDLAGIRRKRVLRKKAEMMSHTNDLLRVAQNLRDAVDKRIAEFISKTWRSTTIATSPYSITFPPSQTTLSFFGGPWG